MELLPPVLVTFLEAASPRASCRYLELTSVERRLLIPAVMNRLVFAPAACPTSSARLCRVPLRSYLAVLLHVQSVKLVVFSLMLFVKVGSEFSGTIGLNPVNDP